jgi:hypothetical protein
MLQNGPNVTEDTDYLFQSDRDLALQNKRKEKQENLKSLGSPLTLSSKILYFEFISPTELITAQSGYIAQKIDLVLLLDVGRKFSGYIQGTQGARYQRHCTVSQWSSSICIDRILGQDGQEMGYSFGRFDLYCNGT